MINNIIKEYPNDKPTAIEAYDELVQNIIKKK